jgi:hypothetical protein
MSDAEFAQKIEEVKRLSAELGMDFRPWPQKSTIEYHMTFAEWDEHQFLGAALFRNGAGALQEERDAVFSRQRNLIKRGANRLAEVAGMTPFLASLTRNEETHG